MIIYFRFNTVAASEPNWMSQPNLCPPLLRRKSALAPGVWPVPFPRIALSRDRRHSRFCLREIHPVQSADAVVEVPQAQRFSDGTGMEIVFLLAEKGRPGNSAQSRGGQHWPDIKPRAVVTQPPVKQR